MPYAGKSGVAGDPILRFTDTYGEDVEFDVSMSGLRIDVEPDGGSPCRIFSREDSAVLARIFDEHARTGKISPPGEQADKAAFAEGLALRNMVGSTMISGKSEGREFEVERFNDGSLLIDVCGKRVAIAKDDADKIGSLLFGVRRLGPVTCDLSDEELGRIAFDGRYPKGDYRNDACSFEQFRQKYTGVGCSVRDAVLASINGKGPISPADPSLPETAPSDDQGDAVALLGERVAQLEDQTRKAFRYVGGMIESLDDRMYEARSAMGGVPKAFHPDVINAFAEMCRTPNDEIGGEGPF